MHFLLNDIADDVIFSFTNNVSCLEILLAHILRWKLRALKNTYQTTLP